MKIKIIILFKEIRNKNNNLKMIKNKIIINNLKNLTKINENRKINQVIKHHKKKFKKIIILQVKITYKNNKKIY